MLIQLKSLKSEHELGKREKGGENTRRRWGRNRTGCRRGGGARRPCAPLAWIPIGLISGLSPTYPFFSTGIDCRRWILGMRRRNAESKMAVVGNFQFIVNEFWVAGTKVVLWAVEIFRILPRGEKKWNVEEARFLIWRQLGRKCGESCVFLRRLFFFEGGPFTVIRQ